jgi:hypothetical protein
MDYFAWRAVFEFFNPTSVRRMKLAIVSGMGDRKFSNLCQKWLHEWTKNISFGSIFLVKNGEEVALRTRKFPPTFVTFVGFTSRKDNLL